MYIHVFLLLCIQHMLYVYMERIYQQISYDVIIVYTYCCSFSSSIINWVWNVCYLLFMFGFVDAACVWTAMVTVTATWCVLLSIGSKYANVQCNGVCSIASNENIVRIQVLTDVICVCMDYRNCFHHSHISLTVIIIAI